MASKLTIQLVEFMVRDISADVVIEGIGKVSVGGNIDGSSFDWEIAGGEFEPSDSLREQIENAIARELVVVLGDGSDTES